MYSQVNQIQTTYCFWFWISFADVSYQIMMIFSKDENEQQLFYASMIIESY